jgi:hypothetical protein
MDGELLTVSRPIGESGAMAEHKARRNLLEPRVAFSRFFGKIRRQWLIEFQLARIH